MRYFFSRRRNRDVLIALLMPFMACVEEALAVDPIGAAHQADGPFAT
jgi:hypothetical protein